MSVRRKSPVKSAPSGSGMVRILRQATMSVRELAYAVVSCGIVVGALMLAHRLGMIGGPSTRLLVPPVGRSSMRPLSVATHLPLAGQIL
jgi:hypothetical protein